MLLIIALIKTITSNSNVSVNGSTSTDETSQETYSNFSLSS